MILAALALLVTAPSGAQATLQPTGQWMVGSEEFQCVARRPYGDPSTSVALSIALSPIYGDLRIAVSGGLPTSTGMGDGAIDFDSGPASKARYGHVSTKQGRETWFRADAAILPQMAAAGTMTLRSNDPPISLRLASGGAMVAALKDCRARLITSWGGQPDAPTALGLAQAISGNAGEWFRDYAAIARQAGAKSPTAAILAISKDGVPIRCSTIRTTGSAHLDSIVCAIASRRLRTKPPLDADGKPALGWYILPLRWEP